MKNEFIRNLTVFIAKVADTANTYELVDKQLSEYTKPFELKRAPSWLMQVGEHIQAAEKRFHETTEALLATLESRLTQPGVLAERIRNRTSGYRMLPEMLRMVLGTYCGILDRYPVTTDFLYKLTYGQTEGLQEAAQAVNAARIELVAKSTYETTTTLENYIDTYGVDALGLSVLVAFTNVGVMIHNQPKPGNSAGPKQSPAVLEESLQTAMAQLLRFSRHIKGPTTQAELLVELAEIAELDK